MHSLIAGAAPSDNQVQAFLAFKRNDGYKAIKSSTQPTYMPNSTSLDLVNLLFYMNFNIHFLLNIPLILP